MASSSQNIADRIGYQEVREYLKHRGWFAVPSRQAYAAIYRMRRTGEADAEVVVPLTRDLDDYADAIETIARRAAAVEGRPAEAVLHDLLQPRKDVVRFALKGSSLDSGSIDLLGAVGLLSGAKKCLLASAITAKRPAKFHAKLRLAEADEYVAACRMAQTEVGSFVLALETPLYIPRQLESETPFGRRATETLFRGAHLLTMAIQQDTVDEVLLGDTQHTSVSANLCDALVEMMPADESADLHLRGTWSPSLPPPADVPAEVHIDRNLFESIEQVADKLRPVEEPYPELFFGFVTELAGGIAAEGMVKLQILFDERMLEVRATLNRDQYHKAAEAHLQQRIVQIRGVLYRGRRVHEIKDVTEFLVLPQPSDAKR